MDGIIVPSQYLQIALDLATRIASGDLPEGSKLYGRSLLASEYNVSPETIRRALRLLADMKVVQVKPQSGAWVLSSDSAKRYIENFRENNDVKSLKAELSTLMEQHEKLNHHITKVVSALVMSRDTFSSANEPLPNYEVVIPQGSPVIGKSIGTLKFWQSTGGTIIAIRRGQTVLLSPGPYAELYEGDAVIFVGHSSAVEAAQRFINNH